MTDTRLDRAIRKWGKLTDTPLHDWAIDQWVKVLQTERTEPTEKVLESMAYLVSIKAKPNLTEIIKTLEQGVPRTWKDRQDAFVDTEGFNYFRMVSTAMASHDHWGELRKLVDWGIEKAPEGNWTDHIRECEEKRVVVNVTNAPEKPSDATGDDLSVQTTKDTPQTTQAE